MDIWSWICELPDSNEWEESNSQLTFQLASSHNSTQSLELRAHKTLDSNSRDCVTFSVSFQGLKSSDEETVTIWVSDTFPLSPSDKTFLPLVLQLLQEIISHSPNTHDGTCPRSQLQNLKPDPVSWILDSHLPESFSGFFSVVFLTRLFWSCARDAPPEVGSFYFHYLLGPNLEAFTCKNVPVLRNFFVAVGADVEICFARTFGYILAKWLILKDVEGGLRSLTDSPPRKLGFSYAAESHGLWILKGYTPVKSMKITQCYGQNTQFRSLVDARQSLLDYALAHQQLEVLIQLDYSISFHDSFIQVNARIDNIRVHVVKLGFKEKSDSNLIDQEKHFPSRVRVWVGPEVGASYVGGLSLGRSTDNLERETEMQRTLKGSSGKLKVHKVKAMARTSTKTKLKNWRWDQDVEGNAATFDAILCDNTNGVEIATWRPPVGGDEKFKVDFKNRYTGGSRAFTKSGGIIFARDEYGEGVGWRLSKEMEGSVLKWRIGGEIWLTYWPNDVRSSYYETRCVEWCDEVDLPLIPSPKS